MQDLEALRRALAVSPDNVPLLLVYAEACLTEFEPHQAEEAYRTALAQEPENEDALLGLAHALLVQNQVSQSILRLEAFTAAHATVPRGWLLLSRALLADGQREAAATAYRRGMSLPGAVPDPSIEKDLPPPEPESEEPRRRGRVTDEGWTSEPSVESARDFDSFGTSELVEHPKIDFSQVGGMESVKEEIRMKILHPLQNAELFKAYGKKAGGGVLLYGPPGCGKTLLSRATAGEIQANFLSVGIHEILDLYIGESEKNLHRLFDLARANAPSIFFIDEVDALAADRRDLRKSAGRTLINQFLAEMDGNIASNEGVLIIGATNAPWHIDPAFQRPGRFDRVLFVPPPDEAARQSIIEVLAREKPVERLDIPGLARQTRNFSGADLKAMFDVAVEHCLGEAMRSGRLVPVTTRRLTEAAKKIKPSTQAWFESAKNYALYANQGGFYNEVLDFLGIRK